MKRNMDFLDFVKIKNFLTDGGEIDVQVVSDSMEPILSVGNSYKVKNCELKALKIFDIIAFWDGQRVVTHFLWRMQSGGQSESKPIFITRSLKDPAEIDTPFTKNEYLGKVIKEIPFWIKMKVLFKVKLFGT